MQTDLQAVLNDTLDLSKQLILCLDSENACLIARKYAQLIDIAEQKQQLINALGELDKQREEFASTEHFTAYLRAASNAQLDGYGRLFRPMSGNVPVRMKSTVACCSATVASPGKPWKSLPGVIFPVQKPTMPTACPLPRAHYCLI